MNKFVENKLLAIVGPTATGKTDLALDLAREFGGELVSCDSRQVYKGLDLISGKIPDGQVRRDSKCWIVDGIPIWMLDMVEPSVIYGVNDYIRDGRLVLEDIWNRGKLSIVVGGTGYYLRGLLEGFENIGVPINEELRQELKDLAVLSLQERLILLSPKRWERLNYSDRNNKIRLTRAIEIEEYLKINEIRETTPLLRNIDILKIGLDSSTPYLKDRIAQRLDQRLNDGMIDEASHLHQMGLTFERMESLGLECRYLARFLGSQIDLDQMKQELVIKINQYAKRQRTWFRADSAVEWFDIEESDWSLKVEKRVRAWYNS